LSECIYSSRFQKYGNTLLSKHIGRCSLQWWRYAHLPTSKRKHSFYLCAKKKQSFSLSLYEKHFISLSVDVYIKPKHDCKNIIFTYLIIITYHSFVKRRIATNNNAKNQPNSLFDHPLGVRYDKLHGTSTSISRDG